MRDTNMWYYLLLVVSVIIFFKYKYNRSRSNLPPGPFPWPVIGNIFTIGSNPHTSLTRLSDTYGPLISLRLGTQLVVVGSTSAAAAEILKTHDRVLSARSPPHAVPVCPDRFHLSLGFQDCTAEWKYLRTLCRMELFSAKAIESQAKIRENKVSELVEFLRGEEGGVVRIGGLVLATIFNMVSNVFVSKDLINLKEMSDDEGMRALVRKYVEFISAPNLADYYTILSGLDLQRLNKKAKQTAAQISSRWEVYINERREEIDGGDHVSKERDFLDTLLDRGVANDQINNLFLELFLAGTDTSTATTEWTMARLIKHPDVMNNVRAELAREIGNGEAVQESNLPRLPYLHSVIKETMRLHPVAPILLPHRASETCKVMNYTIPRGSQVLVNMWAIGRDPNVWEDPLAFKPERFEDSCMDFNSSNFDFIPFGAGRRICPGQPLAMKQVPLILASLITSFDWSLPLDTDPWELDMTEKFGLALAKEKPLLLVPKVKTH